MPPRCATAATPLHRTGDLHKPCSSTESPPGVSPKLSPSTLTRVAPESDARPAAGERLCRRDFPATGAVQVAITP